MVTQVVRLVVGLREAHSRQSSCVLLLAALGILSESLAVDGGVLYQISRDWHPGGRAVPLHHRRAWLTLTGEEVHQQVAVLNPLRALHALIYSLLPSFSSAPYHLVALATWIA